MIAADQRQYRSKPIIIAPNTSQPTLLVQGGPTTSPLMLASGAWTSTTDDGTTAAAPSPRPAARRFTCFYFYGGLVFFFGDAWETRRGGRKHFHEEKKLSARWERPLHCGDHGDCPEHKSSVFHIPFREPCSRRPRGWCEASLWCSCIHDKRENEAASCRGDRCSNGRRRTWPRRMATGIIATGYVSAIPSCTRRSGCL